MKWKIKMNLYNLLKTSFKALLKNGLRTFLTMLGIIIGVSAVIIIQSIGKGTEAYINSEIASLGTNLITISPAAAKTAGVRLDAGTMQSLKVKDVEAIKSFCPSVKYISPLIRTSAQLKYAAANWRSSLMGVSSDYLLIRAIKLSIGSPFTQQDIKNSAKVCLIGSSVNKNLFGDNCNAIGKVIRIGTVPFKVIGVLKEKGQSGFGQDQDDIVLAPYSAVKSRMTGSQYINQIYVSAQNSNEVSATVKELAICLRLSHRLSQNAIDNFSINTQAELAQKAKSITSAITLLLASIAAISLLVGGIGIMNIMLVSVRERTREIGIRLAIGATAFDILIQFLIEAITVTVTAGIIGILLGILLSLLISNIAGLQSIITTVSVLIAFCVCSAIGMFFGWYPARKAANLNPIDALRFE